MDNLLRRLSAYKTKFGRILQQSAISLRRRPFGRHRRYGGYDQRRATIGGEADLSERRLNEQPALKEYGKISADLKKSSFETIAAPKAAAEAQADAAKQFGKDTNSVN